ncbi:hypothetical protein [Photobacterium leiognathi]|uniref:hypothetical protein n=1 Tax=Photobacterium leiognathi TaxID=553611 RepID=UPI00298128B2|nr:hypothetical protein [Photobacterium leiognathi]
MKDLLRKTFGGLNMAYYLRHLLFGVLLGAFWFNGMWHSANPEKQYFLIAIPFMTLLYPYSRWLYETIVDFFTGGHDFIVAVPIFFACKLFTMMMCFYLSPIIAPVGLVFIFLVNRRQEKLEMND